MNPHQKLHTSQGISWNNRMELMKDIWVKLHVNMIFALPNVYTNAWMYLKEP